MVQFDIAIGVWHRMKVVANDSAFDVFLGEPGGSLHHCASWSDPLRTFREGCGRRLGAGQRLLTWHAAVGAMTRERRG
jgi:hypothetical protein